MHRAVTGVPEVWGELDEESREDWAQTAARFRAFAAPDTPDADRRGLAASRLVPCLETALADARILSDPALTERPEPSDVVVHCARSACRRELRNPNIWWNTGSRDWYCGECARRINEGTPRLCISIVSLPPLAERPEVEREPDLPARVVEMCRSRDWSLHWTARGAYLHLESSELIEALRGKRGKPMWEAADVLLVLMSITESNGIPWSDVLSRVEERVGELMLAPRYEGEEHGQPAPSVPEAGEREYCDPECADPECTIENPRCSERPAARAEAAPRKKSYMEKEGFGYE